VTPERVTVKASFSVSRVGFSKNIKVNCIDTVVSERLAKAILQSILLNKVELTKQNPLADTPKRGLYQFT
jgi:hypothetical protein